MKKPKGANRGATAEALEAFASRWGFDADSARMRTALTHKSAAASSPHNNERLEFLGDAVLSALVAAFLLESLPDVTEGTLSRARAQLVRRETLAAAARMHGIETLLYMSASEEKLGGRKRDSLPADAYEALVGALYLDHGEEAARRFILATLREPMASVAAAPPEPDPKTHLQILLQAQGRGLPTYRTVAETGKDHELHFVEEVLVNGESLGNGEGVSKRQAQIRAARVAIAALTGSPPV